MRKHIGAGLAAAVAVVGLAACGGDDEDPTIGAEPTTTTSASDDGGDAASETDFNDADLTFVQSMIPHHEAAIEMAALADGRSESQEVLNLAGRIETAQQPEIAQMRAWLEAWGEDEASMDMDSDMSMSENDMAALEAASGADFDRMFLEMMTEHHRGAIAMAETEVAEGTSQDAIVLAQQIIEDQESEIVQMEGMLSAMG